jgi:hypothetical protein
MQETRDNFFPFAAWKKVNICEKILITLLAYIGIFNTNYILFSENFKNFDFFPFFSNYTKLWRDLLNFQEYFIHQNSKFKIK